MRSLIGLIAISISLASCAQKPTSGAPARAADRKTVQKELSSEMSLKADRQELSDMRKEIPTEKQKSNDELALFLNLMQQGSEQPSMVHDKFSTLVERNRNSFRDKVQKLRETYRSNETDRREEFLEKQKAKRTKFMSGKNKPDETRDFFSKQDRESRLFFADEHDRRSSFESELSAQSKDYESYMREKMNEFNEQYRLYSKKFSERPKEKKAVTGEANDFKGIDQVPAKTLGTED